MKIKPIEILPFHHIMEYSASLTGITFLKNGRYKNRHDKLSGIVQVPGQGFIKKTTERSYHMEKITRYRTKKEATPCGVASVEKNHETDQQQGRKKIHKVNKKKVRHRILQYINQQQGTKQLYFFTITFPFSTSETIGHQLFNTWLTKLREAKRIGSYIWIKELQKNGTIHFHVAIPRRLNVVYANREMKVCIINSIRRGEIDYNVFAAKRYNGVDIAKNRKTKRVTNFAIKKGQKSLANYLTKYLTKNETLFEKSAWHCDRSFSNLVTKINFTEKEMHQTGWENWINENYRYETEYIVFYCWANAPPANLCDYFAAINQSIQRCIAA